MTLTPHKDRVILESFPDEARNSALFSKSAIIIPSQYAETSRLAKVVALGKDVDCTIRVGDTVLCNRYPTSAQAFRFEGIELVSVKQDEILARIGESNGKIRRNGKHA